MSCVIQHLCKCLDEKHIEHNQYNSDRNVIADKNVHAVPIVDPMWDVHGWEDEHKVVVYLRSGISPEFAAEIIEMYENYFHEKNKEKQYE